MGLRRNNEPRAPRREREEDDRFWLEPATYEDLRELLGWQPARVLCSNGAEVKHGG